MVELRRFLESIRLDFQDTQFIQKFTDGYLGQDTHHSTSVINRIYLPMQNREKISPSNSSEWISPVILPRHWWACNNSSAARSSDDCRDIQAYAAPRWYPACCNASMCRLLAKYTFSSLIVRPAASLMVSISRGSPFPVRADRKTRSAATEPDLFA